LIEPEKRPPTFDGNISIQRDKTAMCVSKYILDREKREEREQNI
jgi:hypothetical protein